MLYYVNTVMLYEGDTVTGLCLNLNLNSYNYFDFFF